MTRPTRKGEHLAGTGPASPKQRKPVLQPGYSKFIPAAPLLATGSAATIILRVGDCAAGTTVPNGAGACHPARPEALPAGTP